ncbi:hypothetical protein BSKO_09541 [Bryopsis sp. KO-2023]|nr:hypothetical protein BSKO_09541 [Bryopsis sp. KO-2023]
MTSFMDWEDFKPWTLSLVGSLLSVVFVSRGLLRPLRNRKQRACDATSPVDCEQGNAADAGTFYNGKLVTRFLNVVGLLVEDEETVSEMSVQWVEAVNAKDLKLDVEKIREAILHDSGALSREGAKLIRKLACGNSGTIQEEAMPFPFCSHGTSLARLDALVDKVEKGGNEWRHEGGYEARWLGLAQIHILVTVFHLDPEKSIDWLALFDAILGAALLLWNAWAENHIWTLAISVRGMVTVVPYWKRCKLAQNLLRTMDTSNDTVWGTIHGYLVGLSEAIILAITGSFVVLNSVLCLTTIWPYVWFPYALYTIAPILSGDELQCPKFWKNKSTTQVSKDGSTDPHENQGCGAKSAGNFVKHVEIGEADLAFMVGENEVLFPTKTDLSAKIFDMVSIDRRVVFFKFVQIFMFYVVIAQAFEIASVAGINVYHGENYWDALWKASSPGPVDSLWDGGSVSSKAILELL